jgi:hypothetical protein
LTYRSNSIFIHFQKVLSEIEHDRQIGQSEWRIYKAKELVEKVVDAIQFNPMITHCRDRNCERSNDAVLGGPLN